MSPSDDKAPAPAKESGAEKPHKKGPTQTVPTITWCGGGVLMHDGIEYPNGSDIGHLPEAALAALPEYAVQRT